MDKELPQRPKSATCKKKPREFVKFRPISAGSAANLSVNKNRHQPHLRLVVNRDADFFDEPRRYAQSTSGRSDSTVTFPPDSRSIRIARSSPHVLSPYAMLFRCPTDVSQRSAKSARAVGASVSMKNSLNCIPDYHHKVTGYATPSVDFTNWCPPDDNGGMEINELASIRRANLRRLIETVFKGNRSALARKYGEGKSPSYFSDLVRNDQKSFGEKVAHQIESRVGLKSGQLSIPNSRLEMAEVRRNLVSIELHEAVEELSDDEKLEVLDAIRRNRTKKTRRRA